MQRRRIVVSAAAVLVLALLVAFGVRERGETSARDGADATDIPRDAASPSAIFANPKTMTWADVTEYADFTRDFLTAVQNAITGAA